MTKLIEEHKEQHSESSRVLSEGLPPSPPNSATVSTPICIDNARFCQNQTPTPSKYIGGHPTASTPSGGKTNHTIVINTHHSFSRREEQSVQNQQQLNQQPSLNMSLTQNTALRENSTVMFGQYEPHQLDQLKVLPMESSAIDIASYQSVQGVVEPLLFKLPVGEIGRNPVHCTDISK